MKFSDKVTVRIRNEADYAGFSDNAACLALHSLTAEDLVEALRGGEEPLAIAYKAGLTDAAEICSARLCAAASEGRGCTHDTCLALLACIANIRGKAEKVTT
jgi:hypothetical protein